MTLPITLLAPLLLLVDPLTQLPPGEKAQVCANSCASEAKTCFKKCDKLKSPVDRHACEPKCEKKVQHCEKTCPDLVAGKKSRAEIEDRYRGLQQELRKKNAPPAAEGKALPPSPVNTPPAGGY